MTMEAETGMMWPHPKDCNTRSWARQEGSAPGASRSWQPYDTLISDLQPPYMRG